MSQKSNKPLNDDEHDSEQHQALLSQSESLLNQAMSMFQLTPVNAVEPSFPSLISGKKKNDSGDFAVDASQIFYQQQALFDHLENAVVDGAGENDMHNQQTSASADDNSQLDAIRSMFDM